MGFGSSNWISPIATSSRVRCALRGLLFSGGACRTSGVTREKNVNPCHSDLDLTCNTFGFGRQTTTRILAITTDLALFFASWQPEFDRRAYRMRCYNGSGDVVYFFIPLACCFGHSDGTRRLSQHMKPVDSKTPKNRYILCILISFDIYKSGKPWPCFQTREKNVMLTFFALTSFMAVLFRRQSIRKASACLD